MTSSSLLCSQMPPNRSPLQLKNKAERVPAWGPGLWAACQGCQAAQTSITTELRDKKTAPVKTWKLGREVTCLVKRQSSGAQGFLTRGCREAHAGGLPRWLGTNGACSQQSQPRSAALSGCPRLVLLRRLGPPLLLRSSERGLPKLPQLLANTLQKGGKMPP